MYSGGEGAMYVVLISTYELGHQPFGLASPTAWLRDGGARVSCFDLAVERLDQRVIAQADLIGFYIPMHTSASLGWDDLAWNTYAAAPDLSRESLPEASLLSYVQE